MTIRLLAIALTFGLGCGDFNTTPTCGSTGQGCCHGLCADGLVCTSGFCGRAILPEGCPAIRPTMCGVSCTNTTSDRTNCGRCGNACADAQACSGGTCNLACVAGTTNCTGACRDVTNDNNNCGACGRACAGDQICSNGMCTVSCGVGQTSCSSVCRDLSSDIANCGACDNACTVAQTCAAGSCVTPAPTCPGGMRLIPAGMFLMGDPTAADSDASPIHAVRLTAFCMDETEVSVSAYAACATCSSPATGGACNWGVVGRGSHPVNCVDWNMARAYCQARGGDLPTEAQWEYAARGADGRAYPWGNDAPGPQLCWNRPDSTCPVRTYPSGNSPFGLSDMAGNVSEWTSDWYAAYTGSAGSNVTNPTGPVTGTYHVYRGGWWSTFGGTLIPDFRGWHRYYLRFTPQDDSTGFRCARVAM